MRYSLILFSLLFFIDVVAKIPEGYYKEADNLTSLELKKALKSIIDKHEVLSYEKLWDYYPYTYYVPSNEAQVLDMYSGNTYFFTDHSSMDKEHVVPKSWWGGSTAEGPGCDLFNVIPADHTANVAKSNYSLGEVRGEGSFDNGFVKVGSSGTRGFFGTVFEPKDEYKGDFARIYFYVATCYQEIEWDLFEADALTWPEEQTLKDWIIPMLLSWNESDPVDEVEIRRNEDVYKYQKNRNPFIDYPELANYIWGDKSQEAFIFSDHEALEGFSNDNMKISAPTFSIESGSLDSPKRVSPGIELSITGVTPGATLYSQIDDGKWEEVFPYNNNSLAKKKINILEDTKIKAFCSLDGYANSDTCFSYYKVEDLVSQYLLYDAFDDVSKGGNTSTSSSSSLWMGDFNFPITEKVYQAGGAIRLGTASQRGLISSRELELTGGECLIFLDVKGWTKVEGDLIVDLTGAPSKTVNYSSTMSDGFEHITLDFDNVGPKAILTLSTSDKRAFVDNIIVVDKKKDI